MSEEEDDLLITVNLHESFSFHDTVTFSKPESLLLVAIVHLDCMNEKDIVHSNNLIV